MARRSALVLGPARLPGAGDRGRRRGGGDRGRPGGTIGSSRLASRMRAPLSSSSMRWTGGAGGSTRSLGWTEVADRPFGAARPGTWQRRWVVDARSAFYPATSRLRLTSTLSCRGGATLVRQVDPDGSMRCADTTSVPNGNRNPRPAANADRGELRRLPDGVRRGRGGRALQPSSLGEARRRGAGRDLPRRGRRDLVRVPVDRPRPARSRGRRGDRRGA